MKLNDLQGRPGSHKRSKRLGRGIGSGKGKTSGKGVKGQKARAGIAIHGFEGGQMPLHMRMPKRGFNNIFAREFAVIGLDTIEKALKAGKLAKGATVDAAALVAAGLVPATKDGVRVLAHGAFTSQINLTVAHVTAGARAQVEKAGGSVTVLGVKAKPVNKGRAGKPPGKRTERRNKAAEKRAARSAAA